MQYENMSTSELAAEQAQLRRSLVEARRADDPRRVQALWVRDLAITAELARRATG